MWRLLYLAALLACARADVIVYATEPTPYIMEEFLDLPASFGPDLSVEDVKGLLVVGEPENGCGPLKPPPNYINFTKKWIVLVARYNCSFEEKVRNAQAAGYDCVIVHNVDSDDLESMSAKNATGIHIPSVFVKETTGIILTQRYNYSSGYFIMVNSDTPFNINTHLLLPFAVVVVLCLLVILIFMIVKCIKDRRRARRHRLPNRCLKKIPTCKFSKGDPYETCAICLDDYQEGERLRVLPCAHAYHAKCIDPWLTESRRVCPVCKRKVFAAGERRHHSNSDSDSDDTEPLLNDPPATQGGTFDEQSENPFRRAQRFVARMREERRERRRTRTGTGTHTHRAGGEEASQTENDDSSNVNDEENATEDTQPLVGAVMTSQRERRRPRAPRAHPRPRAHSSPRAAPPPPPPPPAPVLHSADHSINASEPYIGVAALPAPAQASSAPHHVDL